MASFKIPFICTKTYIKILHIDADEEDEAILIAEHKKKNNTEIFEDAEYCYSHIEINKDEIEQETT